jgi:hypothetical protein
MIPGSFKIYTNISKFEPATRNNLDLFGFGYRKAQDPHVKIRTRLVQGSRKDEADPNLSRLGKSVLYEFKHKVKLKVTRGNLMNLLDPAKIQ